MRFEEFEPFMPQRYRSRLPVSFDNSLDLYEQIVAVIEYFNHVIENSNKVTKEIIALRDEFVRFKEEILDKTLPENLDKVLNEWLKNGKLNEIIIKQLLKMPFRNVNENDRLASETDDTGRVQRMIDSMDNGILIFDGDYIISNILGKGEIEYIATKGTTITFTENSNGFYFDRQNNWSFTGFEFDGSKQLLSSNHFIKGFKCNNVVLEKNILKNGAYGFSLENTKNSIMEKNIATGFRYWAFVVFGCDGFKYKDNISNNGKYDGLKFAGVEIDVVANTHKNIEVSGNICMFNERDGFDMAGNNIEGVKIFNNNFNNNVVNGIDFKMVYQGLFMKDVEIYGNTCLLNGTHQINLQINLLLAIAENIYIHNNDLFAVGTTGGTAGLRVYGFKENIVVENNNIKKGQYGIRLLDTTKTYVKNNEILGSNIGIEVSTQVYPEMLDNLIEKNTIETISTPIRITSENVKRTIVNENNIKVELDTFIVSDLGLDTILGRNYTGYSKEKPVGRGTQGEIKRNSLLGVNKPLEWVSLNTNGNAQWSPVGLVNDISEHEINELIIPSIIGNGVVSVEYQQIPCELGDILTIFPIEVLSSNAISWNIYISGKNKIRFIFKNNSDVEITLDKTKWKVIIERK